MCAEHGQRGLRVTLIAGPRHRTAQKCGDSGAGHARRQGRHVGCGKTADRPLGAQRCPPFMVMDVMAAAARIEAAGGRSFTWRSASRRRRRRPPPCGRARALASGPIGYTETLGIRRCARASRDTIAKPTASRSIRARVVVTTGSSAGFILAFLALFEPGDRVAVALPGYPPYRHILTALGCEPVPIETTAGDALGDHPRDAAGERIARAARRRAGREPGQSDRHDDDREALRDLIAPRTPRHPLHLRRDLSRPRLCLPAVTAARLSDSARRSSTRSRNISA